MYLLRTSITFLHSEAKFLVSYLVTCLHKTWLLIEVQKYCQYWYNCNAATARFKYCGCKKFFYGFEQSPSIDPMKHIMCWHSHNQSNDINTLCLAILHVHSGDALSLSFCSLKALTSIPTDNDQLCAGVSVFCNRKYFHYIKHITFEIFLELSLHLHISRNNKVNEKEQ